MSFRLRLNRHIQTLSKQTKNHLQSVANKKSKPLSKRVQPVTQEEIEVDDARFISVRKEDQAKTHNYEMILYWNPAYWPDHKFEHQRLGFKAPATMAEAFAEAQRLADLFSQVGAKSKNVLFSRNNPPVNVEAVYRRDAFKDWTSENKGMFGNPNEFITKTMETIKRDKQKYVDRKGKTLIKANVTTTTR